MSRSRPPARFAEFFAGIGLMRKGLERRGAWKAVWANDIDAQKAELYRRNFGGKHLVEGDIGEVEAADIPDVLLATASFPCVDLSLAGYRQGLAGLRSGTISHLLRILDEMGQRRPPLVLLENVLGFATSHGGRDLAETIAALNRLGYSCDLLVVDAVHFVPQSRPRLFVIGVSGLDMPRGNFSPSVVRPRWVGAFVDAHPDLRMHGRELLLPTRRVPRLESLLDDLPLDHPSWWTRDRVARFVASTSRLHRTRLRRMWAGERVTYATAYRRTREGVARAELRIDGTAGCLRALRGGSSRQILVRAGEHRIDVRFMSAAEYARLMGLRDGDFDFTVGEHQALFAFGDAVCVPVIEWLAADYLTPLARQLMEPTLGLAVAL